MIAPSLLQVLVLTKNEEPNIKRVLAKLNWVEKILVLDSFSTDSTLDIVKTFQNTEIVQRTFDSFASQCNFGLSLIQSKWVLSIDADYVLTDEFIEETKQFILRTDKVAYLTKFKFLVFGKPLSSDNTTPRPVLFLKELGAYYNDGHAHRLAIEGDLGEYKAVILHDDRKSLDFWFNNQLGYSIKETNKLLTTSNDQLSFTGKIRKNMIAAPFLVFFYSLFFQGLIFNGWKGWHYTLQRTMVEILMALRLIEEKKLKKNKTK